MTELSGLRLGLVGLFVLLLQIGFVPAWRPLGVVPDLGLVLLVAISVWASLSTALVAAVALGLGVDLASQVNFGFHTGFYVLLAIVLTTVTRAGFFIDRAGPVVIAVAGATLVEVFAMLAVLFLGGAHLPPGAAAGLLLRQLAVNVVAGAIIVPLSVWARGARRSEGGAII